MTAPARLLLSLILGVCGSVAGAQDDGYPTTARHLRLVGFGNTQNLWNSIAEISIHEEAGEADIAGVGASENDGNGPDLAIDGNLETRWSAHDTAQWIQLDLSRLSQLRGLQIAFHAGDRRRTYFAIDTSMDGREWRRVYYGTSSGQSLGKEAFLFTKSARESVATYADERDHFHARLQALHHRLAPHQGSPGWEDKHLGLVTWYLDQFSMERLGGHPQRDEAFLGPVRELVEALDRHEDYLGSQQGAHWGAHYSPADGRGMPFVLYPPAEIDPTARSPLVVELHGFGVRPQPGPEIPHRPAGNTFQVRPVNRGDSFYEGLGAVTVLELIDYMIRNYPVDPQKVHVTGYSMGGHGTWNMAARFPDRFASAAPLYGYADGLPLQNLEQVPLWVSHGLQDFVVPSDDSTYAVSLLDRMEKDFIYTRYPDSGHSPQGMVMPWLWQIQQANQGRHESFRFTTDHPLRGRHYWIRLVRAMDPHQPSHITASIQNGRIELSLQNVHALEVDPHRLPDGNPPDSILIGKTPVRSDAGFPPEPFLLEVSPDGQGTWRKAPAAAVLDRDYAPGGAGNLYTGEPLMVVYGTQADQEKTKALATLAKVISLRCHPDSPAKHDRSMEWGGFPVKTDREVNEDDLEKYNLILVGGPDENLQAASAWGHLPVTTGNGKISIDGMPALPRQGSTLGILFRNPAQPQRLAYCIDTGGLPSSEIAALTGNWRLLLPGMSLSSPASTPDLVVFQGGTILRMMQYDAEWNLIGGPDYGIPLPEALATEQGRAASLAKAILERCGTDFGVHSTHPRRQPVTCSTRTFTCGDWRVMGNERYPAFVATVTGDMLQLIHHTLAADGPLTFYPEPAGIIEPGKTYTIASFPWITRHLRTLERNCESVVAGPEIGPFLLNERLPGQP